MTDQKDSRNSYGAAGELMAEKYLLKQGFSILEKNYRYKRMGEIDLIAMKDDLLIFVEVKRRSNNHYGGSLYSITSTKQKTIKKVANQYFFSNFAKKNCAITCRFDMISIEGDNLEWLIDIFR